MGNSHRIYSTLTPARLRHLEALADGQPRKVPSHGRAGYDCRVLGWCSFAVRDLTTGEIVTKQEALLRVEARGDDGLWSGHFRFVGDQEIITPEGLRMLEGRSDG